MSDPVPSAKVVTRGKLGGDVPQGAPLKPRRRIGNLMLDRSLQLRYIVTVILVSALIAGSLGFLIYRQEHQISQSLVRDFAAITGGDSSQAEFFASNLAANDASLIRTMVLFGVGLMLLLCTYLIIMTHKVAGPLHKMSVHFDEMAEGRLGEISSLRRGDMLQEFFSNFREMHDSVRKRMSQDVDAMERFAAACEDHPEMRSGALGEQMERLRRHIRQRRDGLR